jgi:hypothetical protein
MTPFFDRSVLASKKPSTRGSWFSRKPLLVLAFAALLAAVAAFHLVNMTADHPWNGDFALYLMHAQNIVEGHPYAETPYVMNPVNNNPSPRAYPPGFPLLLAPVYALFGHAIIPMKVFVIMVFVVGLGLFAYLFRDEWPATYSLGLIAVLGFNPYLGAFMSEVVSDLPFLLFTACSFIAWQSISSRPSVYYQAVLAILTGLLLYFAVLIRSLGVVLPASLLVYELLDRRRPSRGTVISLSVFGFAFAVQTLVSTASGGTAASTGVEYYGGLVQYSILDRLSGLAGAVGYSIYTYSEMLGDFIWNANPIPLPDIVYPLLETLKVLTVLLVIAGWAYHVRTRFSVFDVFTPLYFMALLPWNFHWVRYLIPILPFCTFYVLYAFYGVQRRLGWKQPLLLVGTLCALTVVYGWRLTHAPSNDATPDALSPETKRMYDYVERNTSPDALIVFGKPRFIALYTGRRSVRWFERETEDDLLTYFSRAGVDYVMTGPPPVNQERDPLKRLVEHHTSCFKAVYGSTHFTLLRFVPQRCHSTRTSDTSPLPSRFQAGPPCIYRAGCQRAKGTKGRAGTVQRPEAAG